MRPEIDHANYPKRLRKLSTASLRYIIKDAREALEAMPNNPKAGVYADEINYAAMELDRRRKKAEKKAEMEDIDRRGFGFLV